MRGIPAAAQTFLCDVISEACSLFIHPRTTTVHVTVPASSVTRTVTPAYKCVTSTQAHTVTWTIEKTGSPVTSVVFTTLRESTHLVTTTGPTETETITSRLPESTSEATSSPPVVTSTTYTTLSPTTVTGTTVTVDTTSTTTVSTVVTVEETSDITIYSPTLTDTVTTNAGTVTTTTTTTVAETPINDCINGASYGDLIAHCGDYCLAGIDTVEYQGYQGSFTACAGICVDDTACNFLIYNVETGQCITYAAATSDGVEIVALSMYDCAYSPV